MVLRLKPLGKPTTQKKNCKFWTEPRPCMVLGLKPLGKPTTQFGHNLDIIWPLESIPGRNYPLIVGLIPRLNKIPSLPSDPQYRGNWCNCYRVRCYQKHGRSPSLLGNPLGWYIQSLSFSDGRLACITEYLAVISVSFMNLICWELSFLCLVMSVNQNQQGSVSRFPAVSIIKGKHTCSTPIHKIIAAERKSI